MLKSVGPFMCRYVYVVLSENEIVNIYESEISATREVIRVAEEDCDIDTTFAPLDFDGSLRWGYDIVYWIRMPVYD